MMPRGNPLGNALKVRCLENQTPLTLPWGQMLTWGTPWGEPRGTYLRNTMLLICCLTLFQKAFWIPKLVNGVKWGSHNLWCFLPLNLPIGQILLPRESECVVLRWTYYSNLVFDFALIAHFSRLEAGKKMFCFVQ